MSRPADRQCAPSASRPRAVPYPEVWRERYGPWAVVTGASSGIGRATAEQLAQSGMHVVLVARNADALNELAARLRAQQHVEVRVIATDLARLDGVAAVELGTTDLDVGLLVAAAGFGTSGPLVGAPLERELEMLDVNCRAVLMLTHHFGHRLKQRGRGGIVLFGSIVGFQGTPYAAHYAATKAYVQSLAEALHVELAPYGVHVLASAPGPTASGFAARSDMRMGATVSPDVVAGSTLAALGRQVTVHPGLLTKLLTYALALLPRGGRVRIIGMVMHGMTSHHDVGASARARPGVMLTLLVLLALLAFPHSVTAQQRDARRDGYITTPDSARLYYRVAGTSGDTVIAIHGGPGVDLESIAGDFAPLARRHVVIFYDQRGAGRSTLPADTISLNAHQQVTDLESVRRHFRLRKVTLVAHSYGPLLAASYAIAHPDVVRRMVFFGPVPPRRGDFWQRFGQSMATLLDSAQRAGLAEANARLGSSTADTRAACRDYWAIAMRPRLAEPARTLPLIRSDLCASDPRGIRYGLTTTNRVVMGSYGDWDLRAALASVSAPTLIVHGVQEAIPMDLVEEWTTALPHATLLRVPRAAHFVYAERPELVWPAVERFLGGRPASSRRAPRR